MDTTRAVPRLPDERSARLDAEGRRGGVPVRHSAVNAIDEALRAPDMQGRRP